MTKRPQRFAGSSETSCGGGKNQKNYRMESCGKRIPDV